MRIRLTRRLADTLNGIDLSGCRVGQVIDLPQSDARMLILEGWASRVIERSRRNADVKQAAPRRKKR
jgi:hypothetical protein